MLKFASEFLRSLNFQILAWIYFIFGMIIDICPKFYSALSPPDDFEVKVTNLEIISLSFISEFLKSCIFSASFQIILFI